MKKPTNTATKNGAQTNFNEGTLKLNTLEEVLKGKRVTDKVTLYPLATGVTLSIVEGNETDFGSLTFFGVRINVAYRMGKNGVFISYPQYKTKDGEYKDHVTSYNKDLNALVRAIIEAHYTE